ncbi:MAG TPA: hypothetical protein VI861_02530 [Rickettsiales bacterium]|nr:hypothetical protein [Rickettsiales bacterium]
MSSKKIKYKAFKPHYICFAMVLVITSSCGSGIRDDYLPGNASYRTMPYTTRQPAPARRQGYPQQYQQPYQNQQPYYYGTPNSRSYYNPYDFQQPYGRNPYSDYDQYYVAPTEYYGDGYGSQQEGKTISTFSDKP